MHQYLLDGLKAPEAMAPPPAWGVGEWLPENRRTPLVANELGQA